MTPMDYMAAARVPQDILPYQKFGMWEIRRAGYADNSPYPIGLPSAMLLRHTEATIHLETGECVMEDSEKELRQHLPIWMRGRGRILITGLGLGCVVRGLLAGPDVEHIDVIEIDRRILDVVGPEFAGEDRVNLIHGDALKHPVAGERWDYAWHDIWCDEAEGTHLQILHTILISRFMPVCGVQGAWQLPRFLHRLSRGRVELLRG